MSSTRRPTAAAASSGWSVDARRVGDRATGRHRLEPAGERCRRAPVRGSPSRPSTAARASGRTSERMCTRSRTDMRDRRPRRERSRPHAGRSPSRMLAQPAQRPATAIAFARTSTAISFRLCLRRVARRCRHRVSRIRSPPGKRSADAAATASEVASSASIRASSRSRWARRAGSRAGRQRGTSPPSGSRSRAARATTGSGLPGSIPCTTSKAPLRSASARLARTPTGTPRLLRRDTGTARPSATTSVSSPRASARRPAWSSAAWLDGASTVTSWPRRRSAADDAGDVIVRLVRL